ncbi:hypothetical protein Solca_0443 [Solitalea canadensis DSM 3403]|uniref:Uncharacterized protein n=1 Tax=Solitalea canadensis (strain ATCC 29591 / DSM 3403 / JCM 21819 / LMG 8368 / NBRC 15130 / NCIMB 12057 / USAM 9D) TaxID=929556 RepID=H8KT05_SOLCM|nr:hypothetical protein Solca_0443 [Solitalea canadensis DSM 3403]
MTLSKKLTTIAKLTFVSVLGCLIMYSLKHRLDIDFHNQVIDHQLWQSSNLIMLLTVLSIVSCWLYFSFKIVRKKNKKLLPVLRHK